MTGTPSESRSKTRNALSPKPTLSPAGSNYPEFIRDFEDLAALYTKDFRVPGKLNYSKNSMSLTVASGLESDRVEARGVFVGFREKARRLGALAALACRAGLASTGYEAAFRLA